MDRRTIEGALRLGLDRQGVYLGSARSKVLVAELADAIEEAQRNPAVVTSPAPADSEGGDDG